MAARDACEFIHELDQPIASAVGEPPRTGCASGGEARCARMSSLRGQTPPATMPPQ
jgi:hypothetical protein